MTMVQILQEIISIMVGGIVGLGEGIGTGISSVVKALFFVTSEQGAITGLSAFGGVIAIFAGIALATGIVYKLYILISSFGGRR